MPKVLATPAPGIPIRDGYGPRELDGTDGFHGGLDFTGVFPVHAAADGVVIPSNYNTASGVSLIIRHSQHGVSTGYNHLASGSLLVGVGDTVVMGQQIATSGATGYVTGAHLHFEVIPSLNGALPGIGDQNHDPEDWIDFTLTPDPDNQEDNMQKYAPFIITKTFTANEDWFMCALGATKILTPDDFNRLVSLRNNWESYANYTAQASTTSMKVLSRYTRASATDKRADAADLFS